METLLVVWVEGKPYSRWCELKAKEKMATKWGFDGYGEKK